MFPRQQVEYNKEARCFLRGPCRVIGKTLLSECEVKNLHRSLASLKMRRKGNTRIGDSRIWSRVPQNSNPRMAALARGSSSCKRQIRPISISTFSPVNVDRILPPASCRLFCSFVVCYIPEEGILQSP